MGGEAVSACKGTGSGVAGGEDVDVGVADHDGFGGVDEGAGEGGGFGDEGEEAVRVGFLGGEGVAAIVLVEEAVEAEVGADVAGGVDGFVGEDGHGEGWVGVADGFEDFDYSGVDVGEVELVGAVEVEEEGKSLIEKGFFDGVWVAQGSADEHRGSVADVGGDDGVGERGAVEVGEGGVDGVAEVLAGVDEGSVEIEDEEAGGSVGHALAISLWCCAGDGQELVHVHPWIGFLRRISSLMTDGNGVSQD